MMVEYSLSFEQDFKIDIYCKSDLSTLKMRLIPATVANTFFFDLMLAHNIYPPGNKKGGFERHVLLSGYKTFFYILT